MNSKILNFKIQLANNINKKLGMIYIQTKVFIKVQTVVYTNETQRIIFSYLVQVAEIRQIFRKNRHTIL